MIGALLGLFCTVIDGDIMFDLEHHCFKQLIKLGAVQNHWPTVPSAVLSSQLQHLQVLFNHRQRLRDKKVVMDVDLKRRMHIFLFNSLVT